MQCSKAIGDSTVSHFATEGITLGLEDFRSILGALTMGAYETLVITLVPHP